MPDLETVSIEGLDKAELLAALYNAAVPRGMGMLQYDPTPMTKETAQAIIDQAAAKDFLGRPSIYFDYLRGRPLKIDIGGDEADTWGYDRDQGLGKALVVVVALRANLPVPTSTPEQMAEAIQHAEGMIGTRSSEEDLPGGVRVINLGSHPNLDERLNAAIDRIKTGN